MHIYTGCLSHCVEEQQSSVWELEDQLGGPHISLGCEVEGAGHGGFRGHVEGGLLGSPNGPGGPQVWDVRRAWQGGSAVSWDGGWGQVGFGEAGVSVRLSRLISLGSQLDILTGAHKRCWGGEQT